ncbi:MAG TPA: SIMPL domain-containing protein [Rugosimonospora sp.]|nr:SIMPL domain-containing protein [Rugosimonospora sp.]
MAEGPVVAVRGEVFREVDPEIASFQVTVSARDKDRQEALRRLASRLDDVRTVLDGYAEAIEKRETSGMFVHPETKGSGERVTAYSGSVATTVTVADFAVLGELMIRLADRDQVTVGGPWWGLRPGSPAYREARRGAITDAVTRAREYAEAVGAQVTELLEIADTGMSTNVVYAQDRSVTMRAMAAAVAEPPELNLEPQRQQIQGQVEARFRISTPTALAP